MLSFFCLFRWKMSFVRKLEIQGIRSVGPNDSEKVTVKFDRPFTIITGLFGNN